MNRTLLPTKNSCAEVAPQSEDSEFALRAFVDRPIEAATDPVHCRFTPMHYESGYAYPLIVWLHGPHSNEEELLQVMPLISLRNHVAIAPRGTRLFNKTKNVFGWGSTADEVAEADDRVVQSVRIARQQYHVHPDRIFLAGYAEGGTMALRLAMERPEMFAGAISLGGPTPRGGRPLRNINQAREVPLLLSVSPNTKTYPIEQVMDDLRLLHHAGFSLSLRLYPEDDDLTTTMLADVNDWVTEQACPTAITTAS